MGYELSGFQQRLALWQRRSGTAKVVLVSTAFSCVVSCLLCYSLIFGVYGIDEALDTYNLVLILPFLIPLIVAPLVSVQFATALGTASTVIDELSAARQDLEQLARRDPLTGLLNRRGFFDAMRDLHPTDASSLSIAIVDVDRFKLVNDTFGHATGDELLRQVAERLQHAAGPRAVVARIGGDEFAAAVFDPTAPDELRASLGDVAFAAPDGSTARARCSVGLALHSPAASIDATLGRADADLYREKSHAPTTRSGERLDGRARS
ncbi:GGDEF domain-containing protein [Ilumatobacter coccineus]|uniref:GGDEF domain-containing protein n=1 Tax=Ilumatobacter coccineus (strain NBRC 103263 / KCTC 29153 / YM16-304) TaxID=1313172 RepID=A0A6C7EEQ9_ILUCY|nr:GGDEF domain-containing protein [Ilumatobacter coccineus]BAN02466.1 hypothetical protein YM304_21520 [Ilumatobacter coccineus YM16-304]